MNEFMFAAAVVGIFLVSAFVVWSGYIFIESWHDQQGWSYYKGLTDECKILNDYIEDKPDLTHNDFILMLNALRNRNIEMYLVGLDKQK